jgi:WD40 repeat protein
MLLAFYLLGFALQPVVAYQVVDNPDLISAVAYSPDGNRIAIGGGATGCSPTLENTFAVTILDSQNGLVTDKYFGHSCRILSITWSPDGSQIASGAVDGSIVWDALTGVMISSSNISLGRFSLSWNSNSTQYLSLMGGQPTIEILDASSGRSVTFLVGSEGFTTAADWSPMRQQIASSDTAIRIWDIEANEITLSSEEINDVIQDVEWSPYGMLIASVAGDSVTLFYSETLEVYGSLDVLDASSVAWSPTGNGIAVGSYTGELTFWDVQTQRQVSSVAGSSGAILDIAWSPLGDEVAFVGNFTGNNGENLEIVSVPSELAYPITPVAPPSR